jgi:hypothetical protein
MGHHASQLHAPLNKDACDVYECVVFNGQTRSMAVAVYLDPNLESFVVFLSEGDDGLSPDHTVGEHTQLAAFAPECQCWDQFAGRYCNGVKNVADAFSETMLSFLQGGNRDTACASSYLCLDHWEAFAGFDVWAQTHTQGIHALLHALDIALHFRDIDYRDGCVEGGNRG